MKRSRCRRLKNHSSSKKNSNEKWRELKGREQFWKDEGWEITIKMSSCIPSCLSVSFVEKIKWQGYRERKLTKNLPVLKKINSGERASLDNQDRKIQMNESMYTSAKRMVSPCENNLVLCLFAFNCLALLAAHTRVIEYCSSRILQLALQNDNYWKHSLSNRKLENSQFFSGNAERRYGFFLVSAPFEIKFSD